MTEGNEYLTEREAARARLQQSIDALAEQANLHAQMQKEPLKMLGGASAVGALLGMVVGRQLRRSKKIYVDASSPVKHQKALMKAQSRQASGSSLGGALLATVGTLAVRTLADRVITPKLEALSSGLLERAGQGNAARLPDRTAERPGAGPTAPTGARPRESFVPVTPTLLRQKQEQDAASSDPATPSHAAQVAARPAAPARSTVEAKAQGSQISPEEKANPNLH